MIFCVRYLIAASHFKCVKGLILGMIRASAKPMSVPAMSPAIMRTGRYHTTGKPFTIKNATAVWAMLWAVPPAALTPTMPKMSVLFNIAMTRRLITAPGSEQETDDNYSERGYDDRFFP